MLRPRFVRGLFLPLFVFYDSLLRAGFPLGLRHAGLTTMLAAHVLTAFQVILFRHCLLSWSERFYVEVLLLAGRFLFDQRISIVIAIEPGRVDQTVSVFDVEKNNAASASPK